MRHLAILTIGIYLSLPLSAQYNSTHSDKRPTWRHALTLRHGMIARPQADIYIGYISFRSRRYFLPDRWIVDGTIHGSYSRKELSLQAGTSLGYRLAFLSRSLPADRSLRIPFGTIYLQARCIFPLGAAPLMGAGLSFELLGVVEFLLAMDRELGSQQAYYTIGTSTFF